MNRYTVYIREFIQDREYYASSFSVTCEADSARQACEDTLQKCDEMNAEGDKWGDPDLRPTFEVVGVSEYAQEAQA